jgi:hypothetical protein
MADLCRAVADRWGYLVAAPSARKFEGMLPIHPHWWKYTEDGFALSALDWAKREYFIDDDRVLLLGYSMGGFGTWNVGLRFPDPFFALAPFAGGMAQSEYIGSPDKKRRSLLANARLLFLYFVHGDADRVGPVRFDRMSHKTLEEKEIPHVYREVEGGSHLLPGVLAAARGDFEKGSLVKDLFDALKEKRRPDLESPVDFRALSAPARVRFLSIDEASEGPCTLKARVKENRIRLEAENVTTLSVFFDGRVLDPGGKTVVEINGKEVYSGTPEPSLLEVVKSWRRARDRKRIFLARVRLDVPPKEEEDF